MDIRLTCTQFAILFLGGFAVGATLIINAVLWWIYRLEHPFFEQFKIDPEVPWPWQRDPNTPEGAREIKEWRSLVVKSVFLCIFNSSVTNMIYFTIVGWLYNWQLPWGFHPDDIPDSITCLK